MYQSVRDRFFAFTTTFEGRVPWMYVDVKGLVTTGIGNLIDSVDAAAALPWQHKGGGAATRDDVAKAWNDLKANSAALGKAGYKACESRNDLRLTDAAIDALVRSKLDSNATTFAHAFPDFNSWPADGQLAAMSMSWALGPAFSPKWPTLTAALKAKNFASAAANCKISETGNPGVVPRNVADVKLFTNAAAVAANGADPSTVYYPGTPPSGHPSGGSSAGGSSSGGSSAGGSSSGGAGAGGSGAAGSRSGPTGDSDTEDSGGDTGTGDSGAEDSGTGDSGDDPGTDSSGAEDSGSQDSGTGDSGDDSGTDSSGAEDSGSQDSGTGNSGDDSGTDGSGAEDSGSQDSGTGDSGSDDSGAEDSSGSEDSGAQDSSGSDDSGAQDSSGSEDSGAQDSSGSQDSPGSEDSSGSDDSSGSEDPGGSDQSTGTDG